MAWTATLTHIDYVGSLKRQVYEFSAASVTGGTIVTGLKNIMYTELINKTGVTADQSIDDTTTAGSVVIAGLTSNDIGYVVVYGT